jgi:SAM-dependent methyltransferase
MSWRKYLLIPQLSLYGLAAPRDQRRAWERYWSRARGTGVLGDVLWDADQAAEVEAVARHLGEHADLSLPMLDVGCGNGRQARALARLAPRVVGIDASSAAVERARLETADAPEGGDAEFRVANVAEPGLGEELAAELGECNVHIRGVLHILDRAERPTVVHNLATLLGRRGTAYVCETNVEGDQLEYLRMQGATPTRMPEVLRRCVAAGIRAPSHFGPTELAEYFPERDWRTLVSGPTIMYGVPLRPGGELQRIPSFFAVLRAHR